ncbi:MAG TPA: hypothetical protein VM695_01475 [Phycisphaerae bacterium]|nr:hypothetical protein [Phycisphaerae bacterium]
MTKTMALATAAGLLASGWMIGCDTSPSQPQTTDWRVPQALSVVAGNPAEHQAVLAAEDARVNYRYRLVVLQNYYLRTGNMDKLRWTEREIKNLDEAQTFTWEGLPEITEPKGESLAGADEHLLVEYVVSARNGWLKAMQGLVTYLRSAGPNSYKTQRVANVLDRFDPVRTYLYFLEAEISPADLRPVEVVPQADQMYEKALQLHEQGKGILHTFLTTSYDKQRQALGILLRMVRLYPRSTKIALAAYCIGEIYKEYFNENIRAVHWYERAWQWDANITKPARFQAATVHDLRLFNRAKAIELYRQVIIHEQFNASNVQFSHNRIRELTGS